jgi:hypothetical protein
MWIEFIIYFLYHRFPQELDDPHLGLIKVTIEGAEYWDSASSIMVRAVGYVKAALGNPSTLEGDHKKVNFPWTVWYD